MPPVRRASATGNNAINASGRVHRSNGSNHSVGGQTPASMHSSPYSGTPTGTSGSPQQKIVYVLVNRLKNKLPCYSGITLPDLENEDAVQQTVESLVEISRDSLDIVAMALAELVDKLHKNTDASGYRAIEVLQSQLFLLKVLAIAMASRWSRRAEDGRPGSSTSHRATAPGSVMSAPDSTTGSSTRGSRAKHSPSEHLSALSPWIEPPPLDDNCARYILSVMVIFLKQAAPLHQRLMSAANLNFDASYHDLESIESIESSTYMDIFHTGPVAPPSIGSYYASSEPRAKLLMRSEPAEAPSVRTSSHFAQHTISYERTSAVISSSMTALHTLIAKFAGRVVYHLSASNWAVVFTRIKNNIYKLAGTNETDMDVMDVRLMTHCWLDRARLVQLLQELQSLFVNMKQEAQIAIAGPLRTAIWNWIENHQEEFNDALLHHRRLEGAPERVFDSLYRLVDVSDKAAIWPVLTVLMCISSDRIKAEYQMNSMGVPRGPHGRKDRSFAELLTRTLINPGKSSEVPVICALDVCRAASRIQPSEGDGELPLQSMATDVAHEIKMILAKWDGTQKPFWECPEEIDVALVADALVTVFRFLAEDESLPLFKQCLQPEMSDAVKISALKACITLITESTRISWQKPLDNLKSSIMQRLYGVFHSSITRRAEFDSGILKKANFRPKAKRYTTETLPDRELALHATLALWRSDVHWFLDGLNMANEPYWIAQTLEQWAAPADSSVRLAIARTIRYIQEGLRSTPLGSDVWQAGSAWVMHCGTGTMASIGMSLLHCRTDFESQRMWMHMCHELLYRFTRSTSENQTLIQFTPERAPAFAIAEIALLVTLTSADRVVSATASHCLRLIAAAERQKGGAPTHLISDEEKGKRYPVYEQLGNAKALVLGRVADQKRIRKLVRLIAMPSPSNIAVWEECYWRWCNLNALAGRNSMDPSSEGRRPNGDKSLTTEERQAQWQNLTLFLTSFSASCLGETHDPAALAAIIPARYLPDQLRVLRDPADLLSDFLTDLINLLLAESGQARDVAREALSTEAHPRLYPRILKQLEHVMLTVTAHDSVEWEQLAIFLDQFTAIVKVIVENVQSGEDMRGIDITSTLLTVASYISRFNDTASYRLKVKFCSLCDSFLDQSESFSVRRDNGTRIGIADCIIEWAQEPSVLNDSDLVRAQREINAATLRTAVKLFERLELQLTDEEGQVGEDSSHTVSRLFMRYSSFLFKTFTRTENGLPDDGMSEQTTFSQTRAGGKDGDIREMIINGLASLISANPEYGIKHCLPMTFDADPALRVVFAHVFARVVSKGLKFDPQEAQPPANKQSRLCELIKGSDSALALAICEVCPPGDVDQIINVLLNMFNTRSSLMNLLKAMIDREISRTDSEAALFRSNSTCTRFLSAFARIYGYGYLRDLIVPLIKTMTSLPPGHGYDLDPAKAPNQDFLQNQKDLEFVASSFLEIIAASVPAFPSMFREICAHIGQAVNKVWPEAKFSALGAFIFLRFISPAIVNPALVDVDAPSDPIMRRGLMNIAKIVQNLANNIFFGKEAHMLPLNDFLSANIVNVTRFLSEINKYTPPQEEEQDEWLDTAYDDTDTVVLHRFFDKHADKVGKELLSAASKASETEIDEEKATGTGKRSWNAICNALVETTQASLIPNMSPFTSSEHPEYLDLMSRFSHRDTSPVHHLFVPAVTPQDQPAVFVLSVAKVQVEILDLELLLFYIFKTISAPLYEKRNFEVIFDWTGFPPSAQIPMHWLKFVYEILPSNIRARFRTSRTLIPNAMALRYMRRLYNLTNGASMASSHTLHTSLVELLRCYSGDISLPSLSYVAEQESEPGDDFDEIFMRNNHSMRVPVILRVAQSHLRITTMKATAISNSMSCRATEIIPLADISDIYNVATGHDANEFIIRKIRHGTTLYFTSSTRDSVVKAIRSAKGSMRNVQIPVFERFSRLSNVIATLLHIGMVNIGSDNEELRVASYDLLCSVCTYLDFEGKPVVPTKSIFVPGRAGPFVIQLSEKLASFSPQLTLDFIAEVAAGMEKTSVSQRIACLQYLSPWIKNLSHFTNPTDHLYEQSGAKFRDCVRILIDLTLADQEIHAVVQKCIWTEVGKLDSESVNTILDELMRAAVDGGIGSQRCELVADTMASLTSINVRGRIGSRLRKVMGKTSSKPSKSLPENVHWNEIACLTRLCLVANYLPKNAAHVHLFIAEGAHYVSLVAGTGQILVRTSVYGLVVNVLHSIYISKSTSDSVSPEIQALLEDCASPEVLKLFGLARPTSTSDYVAYDPPNDKQQLDSLEKLGNLLVRMMNCISPSQALLNVWRARWMSLVTSSAFQTCPAIQTRAFITLGILATSDVDDDLLYQMLVAFKTALEDYDDSDTTAVVSMLRCICKVAPSLPPKSRYLPQLFWLAVALIQSSNVAVYIEAIQLMRATLDTMAQQGAFKERGVAPTLLDGRQHLEEFACQIDQILGLSFDSSFSFSLSAVIFKGVRHQNLKEYAEGALRSLLRVTVQSCSDHSHTEDSAGSPICADLLGFFIALLPLSTTSGAFRKLLQEANMDVSWMSEEIIPVEDDDLISRVPFALLGITDGASALYVTSFISAILTTAQGDDTETEILFTILSDIANGYPEVISTTFESLQDQIKDTFATASNPNTLSAVSNVFRVAMQDSRRTINVRGSTSTLSTVEEANGYGLVRSHYNALDELGMQGLTNGYQFMAAGRPQSITITQWIAQLVMKIIE